MVTVVDVANFIDVFASDQKRAELLQAQISFADVVVLNKSDLIHPTALEKVNEQIQSINGQAKVVLTTFGDIPPQEIIQAQLFSFEKAATAENWLRRGMLHQIASRSYHFYKEPGSGEPVSEPYATCFL